LSLSNNLQAEENGQNDMPLNMGIYLRGNVNLQTPNFITSGNYIPGTFGEVTANTNSIGLSPSCGFVINIPLSKSLFISGMLGYNGIYGTLDVTNSSDVNNTTLKMMIHQVEFSPLLRWKFLPNNKALYLVGGGDFAYAVASQIGPNNSAIDSLNIRAGLKLGLGYDFKIGKCTYLSPEITFAFPLTDVSNAVNYSTWSVPQVNLGINLTWGCPKEVPIDTVPVFTPELSTGFTSVNFYNNDGNVNQLEKIKVQEISYQELFPLIPYIFYDENQAVPSPKNQVLTGADQAGGFRIADLKPNAEKINQSTIDIIGSRMKTNTNAQLTITGTKDIVKEKKNASVSMERAEWAKKYLISNYNINPERINVVGAESPAKASSIRVEDGQAENRRIEFNSSSSDIMEPIIIDQEKVRLAEPAYIEFIPYAKSNENVTEWNLEIMQGGKILRQFAGQGKVDSLLWNIYPNELAASEIPVDYVFTAHSQSGLESTSAGTIPVQYYSFAQKKSHQSADTTISKFSLIVFDFDSPNISDVDKEILIKNVVTAIKYKSTVKIFGYTDRIGSDEYNQQLSLKRAENVRSILQTKVPNAKYEIYGVGENVSIYDNNSPIGRQLSRTVQIYVITPEK
jgi:outer membrane protein OmpA-like peptidoglycan-associated protein